MVAQNICLKGYNIMDKCDKTERINKELFNNEVRHVRSHTSKDVEAT